MNIYIALFRGINVGGNNILPMKDLVLILQNLGCENVKTYIQSGNAVFRAKKGQTKDLAEELSSKILKDHGFRPKVMILDVSDLEEAIQNNPFKKADGKELHFFFLESIPEKPDMDGIMAIKTKSEEFRLDKKVFYLYAPDGIGRSKLAAKVEKSLGVPVTARNWNTIQRLRDKVKET